MNIHLLIPQNKLLLYLFWYLIDNEGIIISYICLQELLPPFIAKTELQMKISLIRPLLEASGYKIKAIHDYGYQCYKDGVA